MNLPRTRWLLPIASTFALIGCALQSHPTVMAAGHDLATLWDEIGLARAERLPRLDLAALLGTQWLRPGGGATLVLRKRATGTRSRCSRAACAPPRRTSRTR